MRTEALALMYTSDREEGVVDKDEWWLKHQISSVLEFIINIALFQTQKV